LLFLVGPGLVPEMVRALERVQVLAPGLVLEQVRVQVLEPGLEQELVPVSHKPPPCCPLAPPP
jgi:hypothetical protein